VHNCLRVNFRAKVVLSQSDARVGDVFY
jgi:hypothetical protein